MISHSQIESIIERILVRDTVHIDYHRETLNMVGSMAAEIKALFDESEPGCGCSHIGGDCDEYIPSTGEWLGMDPYGDA